MAEKEVRLIDANRIVEIAEHAYHEWTLAMVGADDTRTVNQVFKKQYLCKVVKAIAEGCPTIDPESLRPHGKWERVSGDMHSSGYAVRCTNCGEYHFVHYRDSLGGLYGHDELFREPPDCPNCGANMKGAAYD